MPIKQWQRQESRELLARIQECFSMLRNDDHEAWGAFMKELEALEQKPSYLIDESFHKSDLNQKIWQLTYYCSSLLAQIERIYPEPLARLNPYLSILEVDKKLRDHVGYALFAVVNKACYLVPVTCSLLDDLRDSREAYDSPWNLDAKLLRRATGDESSAYGTNITVGTLSSSCEEVIGVVSRFPTQVGNSVQSVIEVHYALAAFLRVICNLLAVSALAQWTTDVQVIIDWEAEEPAT